MKKYYCTKCEGYHYRGEIYTKHLKFKKSNQNKTYNLKNKKINLNELRPVAKKQIKRLLKKMKKSKRPEIYKSEIKKVIHFENQNN